LGEQLGVALDSISNDVVMEKRPAAASLQRAQHAKARIGVHE
jgi:hypothetical protein